MPGERLGVNWAAINGSGTRGVTLGQGGLTTQPPGLVHRRSNDNDDNYGTTTSPPICPPQAYVHQLGTESSRPWEHLPARPARHSA